MKSKFWKPLVKGAVVDLVAPGFACTQRELEDGITFLESWGLKPRVPKDIFGGHVLCSHDDQVRLQQLKSALVAKDSDFIWCVRGGYGSIRLVPDLVKMKKPARNKLLVGLSDITSLHCLFSQKWGWPVLHGPLIDRLGKKTTPPQYVEELRQVVFGEVFEIQFAHLKPLNKAALKKASIKSSVTGGNLITLQSTLGTKWEWKTEGRILFFEDIGERGYRIDRVLVHMAQIGLFKKAKAVVFGDFTGGNEPDGRSLVFEVLSEFAQSQKIPVLSGLQTGHDVIQRPLPFGTEAVLKTGSENVLTCHTGVM